VCFNSDVYREEDFTVIVLYYYVNIIIVLLFDMQNLGKYYNIRLYFTNQW